MSRAEQLQNIITQTFTEAFQDGGKKLKSKFSNGNYQVQELIDEISSIKESTNFKAQLAARMRDQLGITPGEEISEEFRNAIEGLEGNEQRLIMGKMGSYKIDSPEYVFVASLRVVSEINDLQDYKDKKLNCNDPETQNVTEVMNPQKACATVPFLKTACDYLAVLQAEVGDIPICSGETKGSHGGEL